MPYAATECIGDLKEALITKYKQFSGLDPSELQLFKLDGSSRILLEPTQMLSEASIHVGDKLAVEFTACPSAELRKGAWKARDGVVSSYKLPLTYLACQ